MEPLANEGDLEARLGRQVMDEERPRMVALLRDASAAVRGYTGQRITLETTTARFVPKSYRDRWGIVLPQWPIVSIDTVVNDDTEDVTVNWVEDDFLLSVAPLTITYTHGYAEIPDDIVAVVCQIAGRAMGTKPEDAGTTSETLGAYSHGTGAAAGAGPLGMLQDEKNALAKYKRPTRPISMLGPSRPPLDLSWA